MKYDYPNLSASQFEELVVVLCQHLFGAATQGFAQGKDGGRDAKFVGTAAQFPSANNPWSGKVIIQAKHTSSYNKSFFDKDFFSESNMNCILLKEIPKIKALRANGELDYYFLVSNRKLTGNTEAIIRNYIFAQTGIPYENIFLVGVEQLELWLKRYPDIVRLAKMDPIDSPLNVVPDELAEIIEALVLYKDDLKGALPVARTSLAEKDRLNQMTEDYSKELRRRYLSHTNSIQDFLADPHNEDMQKKYDTAAQEFNFKIIAKRQDFQFFDAVMEHLVDVLFRDPILTKNKSLTRALLFYMYWNCDIGKTTEDENVEAI